MIDFLPVKKDKVCIDFVPKQNLNFHQYLSKFDKKNSFIDKAAIIFTHKYVFVLFCSIEKLNLVNRFSIIYLKFLLIIFNKVSAKPIHSFIIMS